MGLSTSYFECSDNIPDSAKGSKIKVLLYSQDLDVNISSYFQNILRIREISK